MSNTQQQGGVDESNIKLEKWKPEGSDSVIVALAVIAGNLDSTIGTYNKFLEQNPTIKHKYGYQYKKGKRNLRSNILKLINRVQRYLKHKNDPRTGNPIEFSALFKRKANFPQVPELAGEIDPAVLKANEDREFEFVPGRDELYEQVIQEERAEKDKTKDKTILDFDFEDDDDSEYTEEDSNDDSTNLSFVDTDQVKDPFIPPVEESEQEQQELPAYQKEEEPVMSRNSSSNSVLNPVVAMMKGNDPEYASYNLTHERSIVGTRTDIPAGVDPTNFCSRVLKCGTKIEFIGVTVQSRFDANYTLGQSLVGSPDGKVIVAAFEKSLTGHWSAATTSLGKANTPAEVKSWIVNLPVKVERRPLNPHMLWKPCPPGSQGFVNIVADARSTFYYTFHFVEEDPNLINPLASMGGLMDVTYQQESNPMGVVEMQRSRMQNLNLFATAAAHGGKAAAPPIPASIGGGGGGRRRHHGGGSMSLDSALDSSSSSSSSSFLPRPPVGYEARSKAREQVLKEKRERVAENARRALETQKRTQQEAERQKRIAQDNDEINEMRAQRAAFGYSNDASVSKARGTAKSTRKKILKKKKNPTVSTVSPSEYLNRNKHLKDPYDPRVTEESDDDYEDYTVYSTSSKSRSRHLS